MNAKLFPFLGFLVLVNSGFSQPVVAVTAGDTLDPAGFGSITATTSDTNNYLSAAAYQTLITDAFATGTGGVVFTSVVANNIAQYDVSFGTSNEKTLAIASTPDAVTWFSTIGGLASNVELAAITGALSFDLTASGGQTVQTVGWTAVNRSRSGSIDTSTDILITVTFGDSSTLSLTDTITNSASINTSGIFFSVDGSSNGGISSIEFDLGSGDRGYGIDGFAFTAVPEPSAALLATSVGLGFFFLRRRRSTPRNA